MLTKDDLKQIGEVMDDKLVDVLDAVNKGFSGVQGQIDGLTGQIDGLTGQIDGLKQEVTGMKAVMVTKSYLDEKLFTLKGDLIGYDRKLERKTDAVVDALVERRALTASDLERLEASRVFPRITP